MGAYLDASAAVKLVVQEPESDALRRYLTADVAMFSCALLRVELIRALRRQHPDATAAARLLMQRMSIIDLDTGILAGAAMIEPPEVRSLDAIHVAAALTLGDEVDAVVTYDAPMADAARLVGLRVDAPA